MADENTGRFQTTTPLLLIYPQFDEPKPYVDPRTKKASGEARYSVRLVMDPNSDDFKTLKALAIGAAKAKFPGMALKELKFPFRNGDAAIAERKAELEKAGKEYMGTLDALAGMIFIPCRSKFPPTMGTVAPGKIVDIDPADKPAINKAFFSGALAYAVMKVNAYEKVGTNPPGVNIYLNEILATGQGKRLGGPRSVSHSFAGVVGHLSAEDPTGDLDDEIPF